MKPISISILALAVSVAAGAAIAYPQDDSYSSRPRNDTAQVIRVERVGGDRYSDTSYQHEECWNERTSAYEGGYYRDANGNLYRDDGGHHDSNVNGTIIGAIIGGALGNQVGKGDGRKAATIGGAVIGGAIGNNIDRNNNDDEYRDNSGTVRRCRLVTETDSGGGYGGGGFNVTYRYAGQTYHAYTHRDPGRYIRVLVDVRPQEDGGYRNR